MINAGWTIRGACLAASVTLGLMSSALAEAPQPDGRAQNFDRLEDIPAEAFAGLCTSMQIFAATPDASQMKWVMPFPKDRCIQSHIRVLNDIGPARVDELFKRMRGHEGARACIKRKRLPTADACMAQARMNVVRLFIGFELTGTICAELMRERAGDVAISGVCVPYVFAEDRDTEWKTFLAGLYSGTNQWLEKSCISERKTGTTNIVTDAAATLFAPDKTMAAAVARLRGAGFECKPGVSSDKAGEQICSKNLGGNRFKRKAGSADKVYAVFFGDTVKVSIAGDASGAVSDICTSMVSVGL